MLLFLSTACTKQNLNITPSEILYIKYNNTNINELDYYEIINELNKIKFHCGKAKKNIATSTILLATNQSLYNFNISNSYYMTYQNNNNNCYTKESTKVKEVVDKINNIIDTYEDMSYFTIRTEKNYDVKNEDTYVALDKSSSYIIINSTYPLYDFKINQFENNEEVALLYSAGTITNKRNIVIRKEVGDEYSFKISFKNQYNVLTTILPLMNENNEINFITDVKK